MISLADLQRRIEEGELAADAAIAQSLEAIERRRRQSAPSSVTTCGPRAKRRPAARHRVGIKDIIDTANFPTEMGSPIYRGWHPRADAPVVAMLKRAGATIIGKTTTTAFAANDPTPTLNPHNLGHTPGGSSSGSAAAVGAGMIPLALGTQTGGSVIRPGLFCGAAAIKPSFRMLPTVGVKCYSWALDTVGLFAAGAKISRAGLLAMTGRTELLHRPQRSGAAHRRGEAGVCRRGRSRPARGLQAASKAAERPAPACGPSICRSRCRRPGASTPMIQEFEAHRALAWEFREHHDEMAPMLRASLDETRYSAGGI